MLGIQDFLIFLLSGITLNLMPGPDTMYILGRSITQGRRAGFLSVLGISTGCLFHTAAAAFGLSAILTASAVAFSVVKWAGALYLIYLGIQLFFQKGSGMEEANADASNIASWRIFWQGMLTNLLNPKVALFFMSFLPQFVSPAQASSPLPYLFLGCVFIFTGTAWCLIVAAAAATASRAFRKGSRAVQIGRRITGVVFVGLGIRLALQQVR